MTASDLSPSSDAPRGANISPSSMRDSVADWSLRQVVDYLRKKEKDDKSDVDLDCRLFHTSGIRLFDTIVDELADDYGVSKGRMCRWLSYHGAALAKEDKVISDLSKVYAAIRREAIAANSAATARILDSLAPYSPLDEDSRRTGLYLYNSWVLADFNKLSQVCGVPASQVAQVYMLRSILTSDNPLLESVSDRLQQEAKNWDRWMRFRVGALGVVVAIWGSV